MSARRHDNLSDEKLVERIRDGDPEALKVLVRRYEPLRASLLSKFGGAFAGNQGILDAIADDILSGFLELVTLYDPSRGVRVAGWMKSCLWTHARDAAAKHLQSLEETDDEDGRGHELAQQPIETEAPHETAESRWAYAEIIQRMRKALDPLDFDIFCLWHWDYKYSEIAESLGIGMSKVRNAINREIKPNLTQVLLDLGYEP